jgi:hypothetical protein
LVIPLMAATLFQMMDSGNTSTIQGGVNSRYTPN